MAFSNEYNLNVDIKRRLTSTVPTFRQGDNGVLRFKVYDDGKLFDLSTYTSSEITFVLPSGNQLVGNLDLINGELVYNFTKAEMAEIGKIETFLSITSGLTTVSVQPFYCFIFGTMDSENLSYIGILQELIKEVQDLQLSLGGLLTQLQETLDLADSTVDTLMTLLASVETSENQRITDEDIRLANELIRLDSEQLRNSQESTRIEAEEIRVNNEVLRVNTLNQLIGITDRLESFDYSSSATYNFPNFVTYNGSTYFALQEVSGIVPNDDKVNWRLIAQRGVDGNGAVASVNGILPDQQGNVLIETGGNVIDVLNSTSTEDALSANQGFTLKTLIDNKSLSSTTQPTNQSANDIWFDVSQSVISNIDIANAEISSIPPTDEGLLWLDNSNASGVILKKYINGEWIRINPATTVNQVLDTVTGRPLDAEIDIIQSRLLTVENDQRITTLQGNLNDKISKSGDDVLGKLNLIKNAELDNSSSNAILEIRTTNSTNSSELPRIAFNSDGAGVSKQLAGDHVRGGISVLEEDGITLGRFNCREIFVDGVDLKQSGIDAKNVIATAVNSKGVPASSSDTFTQLATKIGQISGGASGTASFSGNAVTVSGLGFTPTKIIVRSTTNPSDIFSIYDVTASTTSVFLATGTSYVYQTNDIINGYVNSTGFRIYYPTIGTGSVTWYAGS